MNEPTATPEVTKKSFSPKKIITLVVLMASFYAVSFVAAQWALSPDSSETTDVTSEKGLQVGSAKTNETTSPTITK